MYVTMMIIHLCDNNVMFQEGPNSPLNEEEWHDALDAALERQEFEEARVRILQLFYTFFVTRVMVIQIWFGNVEKFIFADTICLAMV